MVVIHDALRAALARAYSDPEILNGTNSTINSMTMCTFEDTLAILLNFQSNKIQFLQTARNIDHRQIESLIASGQVSVEISRQQQRHQAVMADL